MKQKIFTIIICLFSVFLPLAVFAAGLVPDCGFDAQGNALPCGLCDIFRLIKNIFNFIAFQIVPPVGGLMVLVAGVLFLTSAGSEERVKRAKKIFTDLIIGLVIVYASFLIVGTLINIIARQTGDFSPQNWNTFKCN
jgi:hypothetical protein